jgi:hypothetical protein
MKKTTTSSLNSCFIVTSLHLLHIDLWLGLTLPYSHIHRSTFRYTYWSMLIKKKRTCLSDM